MDKKQIHLNKEEEIDIFVEGYNRYITLFEKDGQLWINHFGNKMPLHKLYSLIDWHYGNQD